MTDLHIPEGPKWNKGLVYLDVYSYINPAELRWLIGKGF